jgi:DNA-binding MarR family transcriptional regulator
LTPAAGLFQTARVNSAARSIQEVAGPPTREQCLDMRRQCVSFTMRRAARAVTAAYDEALIGTGLTACQLTILAQLSAGSGASLRHLAGALELEPSTLSRNLALLARKSLVRLDVGADRREKSVHLTPRGEVALAAGYACWRDMQQRLIGMLASAELEALLGVNRRLTDILRGSVDD